MTARLTDRITSPWVMGAVAAATSLGIALALCVVPALAAQVAATRSSLGALGAVLLGIDAFVLAHGGSLTLSDGAVPGPVRLMPLGLTLVLALVAAMSMRRMGRALSLVTEQGVLRTRALRDAAAALVAFVGVYAAGGTVLAALARTQRTHPVTTTAVVGCGILALVAGASGLAWTLRRRESPGLPAVRLLDLLPDPFDAAARGAAITLLGLVASGMLVVVGSLLIHLPRAGALLDRLDPGVVGGTVLLLVQLALLPTLALWALSALLGGSFTVGMGTTVSLGASTTGVLPALPLLAVLPAPGPSPWYAWLLLLLPLAAVGLGAVSVVRDVAGRDLRTRATAWATYAAAVMLGVVALLTLSRAGIGSGGLRAMGPVVASTLLPLLGMLVLALVGAVAAMDSPLVDRTRAGLSRLRDRVERSEAREGGSSVAAGSSDEHGAASTVSADGRDDRAEPAAVISGEEPAGDDAAGDDDGADAPGDVRSPAGS